MTTQDRALADSSPAISERDPEGEPVGSAGFPPPLFEKAEAEERIAPTYFTKTPSGIEIRYFAKNKDLKIKRHYETLHPEHGWVIYPSVTDTLKVLAKDALTWWGQRVGVEGTLKLVEKGILRAQKLPNGQLSLVVPAKLSDGTAGLMVAGEEQVTELLKQFDLTVDKVRDLAGDRGQSAHDALELFCKDGVIPDPGFYPPDEQPYIIGLRNFILDAEPETIGSEVMVSSNEHGFSGRYDWRIKISSPKKIVKHATPVKGAQYAMLPKGIILPDLKTSKDAFDGHCEQLEAYERASVECGWDPTDARAVLVVGPETQGKYALGERNYKLVKSWATFDDYRATLSKWQQNQHLHKRFLRRND